MGVWAVVENAPLLLGLVLRVFQPVLAHFVRLQLNSGRQLTVLYFVLFFSYLCAFCTLDYFILVASVFFCRH